MLDQRITLAGGSFPGRNTRAENAVDPSVASRPADLTVQGATATYARTLNNRYGNLPATALLEAMLHEVFHGGITLVSSFGTESAVLLDLVAKIDPATPVLFLDTGKLFIDTLRYRDALVARLGLTDVRILHPDTRLIEAEDDDDALWRADTERCCQLRKVMPLSHALAGFDAWITGRKRFQGNERGQLSAIEADVEGKIKINPLAHWTPADIATYFTTHALPFHPLEADGYRSIGCAPCTVRVKPGEDPRAGRWRHSQKTECGIHTRPNHAISTRG